MTKDDVLFGYRLQLFALAGERGVSEACRVMGVHRSTYYRWKAQVDRQGLEMLRPKERRRPQMPNQLSVLVEQRVVAFSLGHPGLGPRRIASSLARPEWGGLLISSNGVYKTLVRHGLNTRTRRLSLVAGYRAPTSPRARPRPSRTSTRHGPASWSGSTAFSSAACTAPPGRSGRSPPSTPTAPSPGPIWWCARAARRAPPRPPGWPIGSLVSCRRRAGAWSGSSATTATSSDARPSGRSFLTGVRHSRIRSGRPQTNGHVERLQRTILEECWRPAFARFLQVRLSGLGRTLAGYLDYYNHQREHHGRITAGRRPAEIVYGARKMEPE